jgi:hypothetical protein
MPRIQFTTPAGASGVLELDAERMSLGRADDNMLIIADDSVSSHHGEVAFDGNSWTFTDLGSNLATWIACSSAMARRKSILLQVSPYRPLPLLATADNPMTAVSAAALALR